MKNFFTSLFLLIISSITLAQSTLDSGLVACFPFNGNTIDVTGNGYDGTINGNAALVPDRFGSIDKAFTFPDQSSSISLTNSVNINLETGFTINAWIKYKAGGQKIIVCKHTCGFSNGFIFMIDWDGQISFYLSNGSWSTVRTNQTFVEDQWYMATAIYDPNTSTAKVYIDGELGGSGNVAYNNFSSNPISIGESYQNNCVAGNMNGAVDEVKIYNRPLNDSEILQEYNNTYSDLVLFLPFNGNANDESGSGNNGTVNGATLTQDRFGIDNKAYQFDGINDYISIADNPNLFSDELTISWWYKLTETPGAAAVVVGWVDGGHRYQQFFSDGQLSYLNGYNVAQPGIYFNPIYGLNDLNVWKNVVVTYQKTGASASTTSIYVDGELKQTDNHTLAIDYVPGIEFFIGKNHNGNFFKGYLDDFRIFNRVLDSTEIVALYNDLTTYFPDSLIADYQFNGNANDESGNNLNGTVNGATLVSDRYGIENSAFQFNGVTDNITVPHNSLLTLTQEITLSAWVKRTRFGIDIILEKGGDWTLGTCNYGMSLHYLNNNMFYFFFSGGWRGTTGVSDYDWHHYAVIAKHGEQNPSLYIDGVLKPVEYSEGSQTINLSPSPLDLHIGSQLGTYPYYGANIIDDIKIFNKTLSQEEILILADKGLIAYFPFNGNANDESALSNHGTVYDALLTRDRYANPDQAYYFNGSSSRIQVPENSFYDFGFGDFTMSAWINVSLIGTSRFVSAGYDANDNIWGLGFGTHPVWGSGNRINYFVYSDNNFRDFSSDEVANYSPGEWIFVAASKAGNQIKFYANGFPIGSQNINYPSNANSFMSIGCRQYSSGVFNEFFNGTIDEVKIFNKSFTDEEILEMYETTTTAPDLIYPPDNATINTLTPEMDWDSLVTATNYSIQIAVDSLFSTIILSQLTDNSSYSINSGDLSANTDYYWRVRTNNDGGIGPWSKVNKFKIVLTDVAEGIQLPTEFALMQNYPNPFNPSTTITYHLPKIVNVELKVYDVLGNEVATLVDEYKPAGIYNVQFKMDKLSSGVYFYQLRAGDFIQTKKMIIIK